MAEVMNGATDGALPTNGTDKPATPSNDENAPPNGVESTAKDGENITVFHDPENFNVKHPLMNKWTLWFTKPPSGKVSLFFELSPTVLVTS